MLVAIAAITAATCPIFPSSFSTNQPVTDAPVLPNSDALVRSIGSETGIHPDFGSIYGIPFDKVSSKTPRSKVSFDYSDESDHVRYPIPKNVHIESGGGDRHGVLLDTGACKLYELYALERDGNRWHAGSGAVWNLRSKKLRPAGWTSADAAGLPIYPLLARYGEFKGGVIKHAIRMTVEDSRNAYVYPARHFASDQSSDSLPRMGERFRLKASYDISGLPKQARVVAQAMKTYGLIVADNGSDWYITGAPDKRWSDDDLHALGDIHGSDFEAVDASGIR